MRTTGTLKGELPWNQQLCDLKHSGNIKSAVEGMAWTGLVQILIFYDLIFLSKSIILNKDTSAITSPEVVSYISLRGYPTHICIYGVAFTYVV